MPAAFPGGPAQPTGPIIGGAEHITSGSIFAIPLTQRPLYVVRTRLQARGLWPAMVAELMSNPDQLLRLLSAEQTGMVDATDADTIAAIQAIGGDPAEILA